MILQAMGGRVAVDLRSFLSLLPPFSTKNRRMDLASFLVKSGVLCGTFRHRRIFFGEMVVSFGKPEVKKLFGFCRSKKWEVLRVSGEEPPKNRCVVTNCHTTFKYISPSAVCKELLVVPDTSLV